MSNIKRTQRTERGNCKTPALARAHALARVKTIGIDKKDKPLEDLLIFGINSLSTLIKLFGHGQGHGHGQRFCEVA
jgi:hypothetical protein